MYIFFILVRKMTKYQFTLKISWGPVSCISPFPQALSYFGGWFCSLLMLLKYAHPKISHLDSLRRKFLVVYLYNVSQIFFYVPQNAVTVIIDNNELFYTLDVIFDSLSPFWYANYFRMTKVKFEWTDSV